MDANWTIHQFGEPDLPALETGEKEVAAPAVPGDLGLEPQAMRDDAWAYRVEVAIIEERITQLEKWKQDKMSNVQYIWAELGAKHVKLGQEQEQLEKLTKMIEKEMQEVEALKSKYQQEDSAVSPHYLGGRDFSKHSGVAQVPPPSMHQVLPLDPVKRALGRPRKHPASLVLTPSSTPGKRKRGRPTKLESMSRNPSANITPAFDGSTAKRPRGRPRKYPKTLD